MSLRPVCILWLSLCPSLCPSLRLSLRPSLWLSLWLSLYLAGCAKKEEKSTATTAPAHTLLEELSSHQLPLGDTLSLRVKTTATTAQTLDSVRLWWGQDLLWAGQGNETAQISTASLPAGRQLFRIEALLSGGQREQHGYGLVLLAAEAPVSYGYRKQQAFPHDEDAYTQGLLFHKDVLYESTGQYGSSTLRRVELESGKVLAQVSLGAEYFGEGMAVWEDKIYLLTWKGHKGFIYTHDTFQALGTFAYPTEGWGLSAWQGFLVMSDGSEKLYFYTPHPWTFSHSLQVYDDKEAVKKLNELETIGEHIYANVYGEDYIVVIDPHTGAVKKRIELAGLLEEAEDMDVLNGIAYNATDKRLYVTGKRWPFLFEIVPFPL